MRPRPNRRGRVAAFRIHTYPPHFLEDLEALRDGSATEACATRTVKRWSRVLRIYASRNAALVRIGADVRSTRDRAILEAVWWVYARAAAAPTLVRWEGKLRRVRPLDFPESAFWIWMRGAVAREADGILRQEGRGRGSAAFRDAALVEAPCQDFLLRVELDALRRIASHREQQVLAILEADPDAMDADLAEVLGVSRSTARTLLERLRKRAAAL